MFAQINHMAMNSPNWPMLMRFYEAVFGLKGPSKSRPMNGGTVGDERLLAGARSGGDRIDDPSAGRVEFRDDWSNQAFFQKGSGSTFNQPTFLLGMVAFLGPKK